MTIRPNLNNATGTLYPNPRFGEVGEPPLRGVVFVTATEGGTQAPVALDVYAWYQSADNRSNYVLYVDGDMQGELNRVHEEEHHHGCPDFEGGFGLDWEPHIEGWLIKRDPKAQAHIYFRFYVKQKSHISDHASLAPIFF